MKLKLIALCTLLLAVLILGASAAPAKSHPMGSSCSGPDVLVCHLTVSGIRQDEADPNHSAVTVSVAKQNSLYISGDVPFTLEFVADDGGPYPFYRPVGAASKVFSSGPARPEAANHKYHLVIHDAQGVADPHIVICNLC